MISHGGLYLLDHVCRWVEQTRFNHSSKWEDPCSTMRMAALRSTLWWRGEMSSDENADINHIMCYDAPRDTLWSSYITSPAPWQSKSWLSAFGLSVSGLSHYCPTMSLSPLVWYILQTSHATAISQELLSPAPFIPLPSQNIEHIKGKFIIGKGGH